MYTIKAFWLPHKASTFANSVDWVFNLYSCLSALIFFAVAFAIAFLVIIYLRRRGYQPATGRMNGNLMVETAWTMMALLVVMSMFFLGMMGYWNRRVAPANALQVDLTGRQWKWTFDYTLQGITSDTLVVPVHQPVRLRMTSKDVIHAFFIPAFRVQADVIPGRYNSLWFEADTTGVFQAYCAQFCGTNHSFMGTNVRVVDPDEFTAWVSASTDPSRGKTPAEYGAILYTTKNCNACHKVEGSVGGIGPDWKGIWGAKVELADGRSVIADSAYLVKSMTDPNVELVKGFLPIMPPSQGLLTDREIAALTAYIKSLK
jgi:cytochrome c oxidase subunit 2